MNSAVTTMTARTPEPSRTLSSRADCPLAVAAAAEASWALATERATELSFPAVSLKIAISSSRTSLSAFARDAVSPAR
jgi:hypothetical protein